MLRQRILSAVRGFAEHRRFSNQLTALTSSQLMDNSQRRGFHNMEDAISNDRRDSEEVKENSTNPTLPPNLYRSGNSFQRTEGIKLLDEQRNSFKEGVSTRQRYLDIGCGTGELTREILLNHGNDTSNVVGVDISPEMIDYARRYSHHPCISYDVLDIGTADLSNFVNKHGTFDRVYSFLCLNWVSDKDRAFRNIATLLKDDGQFLLAFLVKTDLQAVWLHFAESPQWKAYMEVSEPLIGHS